MDNFKFEARKGLEGPFTFPNGRTLYYDPVEGQHYDPLTDYYVSYDEMAAIQQQVFDRISGNI